MLRLAACSLLVFALHACNPSHAPTAVRVTDDDCPAGRAVVWRGEFRSGDWLHAWDPSARFDYGEEEREIVSDPRFGSILRVHFPAGSSSHVFAREGHPEGGLELKAQWPGHERNHVFMSYWIRFDERFEWVRGGKLPGFCGGRCPSGGALVTGEGGWSVRSMWRPEGQGEEYAYILPAHEYGTELGLGAWHFQTGKWHRVAQEIVLNTGALPNGVLRVWYDADVSGAPTFEARDLTFRHDETPVDALFFSTFFGGHDATWATPNDTFIDFARFSVCE